MMLTEQQQPSPDSSDDSVHPPPHQPCAEAFCSSPANYGILKEFYKLITCLKNRGAPSSGKIRNFTPLKRNMRGNGKCFLPALGGNALELQVTVISYVSSLY